LRSAAFSGLPTLTAIDEANFDITSTPDILDINPKISFVSEDSGNIDLDVLKSVEYGFDSSNKDLRAYI
jgi:uncharacterized linocin/CFP29 family protein